MSYQLEISFRPVNEMINSLHTYLCKSWHKRIDLGPDWARNVEAKLSPEFADQLNKTAMDLEWKLLYLLVYVSPSKDSTQGFLSWLKNLTLGELYEVLSPYVQTFPENFGAARDRLHDMLTAWNDAYFTHVDSGIISALQAEAEEKSALQGLNAYETASALTNGFCFEPVQGLEKLVLVPQYHFQPGNIIYSFGSVTVCHYAARIEPPSEADEPSLQLYRLLRSLSEKSRLRILHFLRDEPRTFIEVVRHLGISKGITHDHIFNLRSAGLLNAHVVGETVSTYSLRLERIRQIEEGLLDYLGFHANLLMPSR
ncbi:ArsR/SmtB family transcription factor [Paenibacillus campinasensis]|uniref:Transcriptional regulator n=1 Tax=Paenibacillus campinasensis TaxID=66347 RepID=A0A268EX95_9BACL|nr:winged helix-turn-helix domain-containing protein [Paenibacillus campinasensis]PAD77740.1 transcriptional regulator [Paenibacillus campinasensis]